MRKWSVSENMHLMSLSICRSSPWRTSDVVHIGQLVLNTHFSLRISSVPFGLFLPLRCFQAWFGQQLSENVAVPLGSLKPNSTKKTLFFCNYSTKFNVILLERLSVTKTTQTMWIFWQQTPGRAFRCARFCQAFVWIEVSWWKTAWPPLSWLLFCLRLLPFGCSFKEETAIFCDRCETFAGIADGEKSSDVKWRQAVHLKQAPRVFAGRRSGFGGREAARSRRCCPLSLICLSLPGIHRFLSRCAQQRSPSCTLQKARLLNKPRVQAGGIPAAGVSQPGQKRKMLPLEEQEADEGEGVKRRSRLINRVHRWRSDDMLAWERMSPQGCCCQKQTHSVPTDPQFQSKSLLSMFHPPTFRKKAEAQRDWSRLELSDWFTWRLQSCGVSTGHPPL